jgi:K+-sensing histidine kinase KdpD
MQEFLGDASHELRTPLTVIRGYLELLEKKSEISSEQSVKAISRAHQESLRMQAIISDILLLAELGEKPSQKIEKLNLEEIFEPLVEDLKIQEPKRNVEMISNQHTEFFGARELLVRFLQNALTNIQRYTPSDAQVKVSIVQSPVGLEINIDDSGPGIAGLSESGEVTAFKRFDDSRSRGSGGSGLGLSIMAKIIENHGGEMRLTRSALGGLRVSAFIPC